MKQLFRLLVFTFAVAAGCSKEPGILQEDESTGEALSHDMIVLGEKLDDPYSVKNVTKALDNLYPTRSDRTDVTPTDVYIRFLPKTDSEYKKLTDSGFELMDHPLDYQIVKDGDYYHDPEVDDEDITWQYAVIPHGTELPEGVEYEILDDCYIPEAGTRSDDGIDWDLVEAEAFRITGNEDLLCPGTRGGASKPEGRITIIDKDFNGGQPFGVAGVRVVCNVFVKFASASTDRDGYYRFSRKFSSRPRYRLMFKNTEGFAIGFNKVLVPASWSALGKGDPEGKDAEITRDSNRKLWCRSVVNNAAYDYFTRCTPDDMGITKPPRGLRIWLFQNLDASSAVMMKHGAIIDNSLISKYLGSYTSLLKVFLPDITLGLKGESEYSEIYSETCHELAHASHFVKVGKSYWDNYIKYLISSFIASGGVTYGDGTGDGAGYCEVGEMWSYFMQDLMFHDRYGGIMPSSGISWWFYPQIFRYLEERGITRGRIFSALTEDVDSRSALQTKLLELNPEKSALIRQTFDRYAE